MPKYLPGLNWDEHLTFFAPPYIETIHYCLNILFDETDCKNDFPTIFIIYPMLSISLLSIISWARGKLTRTFILYFMKLYVRRKKSRLNLHKIHATFASFGLEEDENIGIISYSICTGGKYSVYV